MRYHDPVRTRGFTLIELLVVIAIVAVLAVTVILTLNPAQLLRQARDSNRINDLVTLESAILAYLDAAAAPTLTASSAYCYAHASSSLAACDASAPSPRFADPGMAVTTSSRSVSGGWLPVDFGSVPGSPLAVLPVDPINNGTYFYAYRADAGNRVFEINAKMESARYRQGGSHDVESTDGGNASSLYEIGTAPGLSL